MEDKISFNLMLASLSQLFGEKIALQPKKNRKK